MNSPARFVARTFSLVSVFLLLGGCAEGIVDTEHESASQEAFAPSLVMDSTHIHEVLSTRLVPEDVTCVHVSETPLSVVEATELGFDHMLTQREPDMRRRSRKSTRIGAASGFLLFSTPALTAPYTRDVPSVAPPSMSLRAAPRRKW